MSALAPADVAKYDQAVAHADAHLDRFVAKARAEAGGYAHCGEHIAVIALGAHLTGNPLGIAELLAAAVVRLASMPDRAEVTS